MQFFQVLQTLQFQTATETVPRSMRRGDLYAIGCSFTLKVTINRGEPVLASLSLVCRSNFQITARAELIRNDLLGAAPDPLGQIVFRDNKVPAARIRAPDHDMRVRMPGIVMIDSNPVEARSKIMLHLGHKFARAGFEITQLARILGGYGQAKLMPVIAASLGKIMTINCLSLPAIEFTAASISLNTVALNISNMLGKGPDARASTRPCNMDFDDDAAHPGAANLPKRLHGLRGRAISAPNIAS